MSRVALFVDAGYLFAQGGMALTGEQRRRTELKLNESAIVAELMDVAKSKCDGVRALRTYWYDAAPSSGLTAQHIGLANMDRVKLRLGAMNGQGQQKGVDSLIVTDMIELARNRSICDAVLLSGDEDVRIGVQIAQNYGVVVHLIGIHPARGSQSVALRQEADTTTEWDKETVGRFLTATAPIQAAPSVVSTPNASTSMNLNAAIDAVIKEMTVTFDSDALSAFETYWGSAQVGLPGEFDRPFLGKLKEATGRMLEKAELRQARHAFEVRVRQMIQKA
ncbi:NYN domain-containing protein [Brevundimonas sp.]|uniref:NYN domain-containing protein n=1 Tax=Brevundimonas sp. TaxID=1871086 RepID=UPI003562D1CE